MTIVSTGSPAFVILQGNGASIYTFPFKAFPSETNSAIYGVNVWLQDADGTFILQTQGAGADYTVTTTNSSAESGTITFKVAVPTTKKVLIFSATPYTQTGDFSSANAAIAGPALEKALDRLATQIRQINRDVSMTLHLEIPPEIWPLNLLIDPIITDGATVYWQKDATQNNTYYLKTSDFTINDLKDLVDDIDKAVIDAQAAAQTAQTAANNAATAAQNAANAVSQLNTSITQIIADLNAIRVQVQGIQAAINAIDVEVKAVRDQVLDARDDVLDALTQIQALVAKFPDPAGQPINLTYVTNGAGAMTFQPYYPIIGMDTATSGQVITVQDGPQGKELIAASPITTSEKVATFNPLDEGGVTVSAALISHEAQINALNNTASIFAYGRANAVADFIVNVDGNLRSTIDTTVVTRTDAVNIKYEKFGLLAAYYTSGNNFVVPQTINSRPLFGVPTTMMFGVYIDANMPDTVIFANNSISVKKVATSLQLISGALTKDLPLVVNQWVFYCLIFNGTTLTGHTAQYAGGNITLTDIASTALPTAIVNADLNVNMETNLRLVRLTFVAASVTKDQFDTWVHAIYGLSVGMPEVPEANTGQDGQAIVVESGSYALKYPLLLDPIAAGYTVDNSMEIATAATGEYVVAMELDATAKTASFKPVTLDFDIVTNVPAGWTLVDKVNASTELAATGLYNWYFDVDATAKTITLKVNNMNPAKTLNTTLFNITPTPANPQQLIAANPKATRRTIQNYTSYDIVIGTQAQLTANAAQGFTIRSGYDYETESNGALFVLFPTGANSLPAGAFVKIIEEVIV